MRTATILLFSLGWFFLSGCEKEEAQLWAYYDETNCSDPWAKNNNNFVTQDNIVNYLGDKGIRISGIKIKTDGVEQTCGDCKCTTGRRILVNISEKDAVNISTIGFHTN